MTALPAQLTASVSDPDGDSLTVTFYGRPVTSAGPDFTLVEIPDTQYYSASMNGGTPAIFQAQTQWIAANRVLRNIAYVAHVGDIVENGGNGGDPTEWKMGDGAMRLLEDPYATSLPEGIPFGVSAGNHDIGSNGSPFYNQYFGVGRFAGRSYYGGHRGSINNNWFNLFSASGLDFIVIGLELTWAPDAGVVHWADSLLTAYPNRRAILVSHYLLDPGPPVTFSPQGQAIYDGLKGHANLILMICGHWVNEARRTDTYNGHTIHTVMANYQNWAHGGDGWLRIMEFSPANNQIRMRTYSPWLGQFRATPDSSAQFTLPCDLSGGDGAFHPIGTLRRVPSASTASIQWTGLRPGKSYEWYVTVSDGSSSVNGPRWPFQLVDSVRPTVRMTAPNGGEVLEMGQWADLRWNATDDGSGVRSVDLVLSRNGPHGEAYALASGIPNTGAFRWRVDGPSTTNACFTVVVRDSALNWALDSSDGPVQILATTAVGEGGAGPLAIDPVSPNPTRGPARFGVTLPHAGAIRLSILDVAGREVAVPADGFQPAGMREFRWDGRTGGRRAPAGVYLVRLECSGRFLTRKFVIAR